MDPTPSDQRQNLKPEYRSLEYYSVDPGRSACHECNEVAIRAEAGGPYGARWRLF